METARINEVLAQQIAMIREQAALLDTKDVRRLRTNTLELEKSVDELQELIDSLP